ncbi:MAG: phosphatidylserine decarboxylase [Lachnospiraceae bacterium]|nr:phosphatidylserine decarboxylase [Lachnospiraceae bacterium]
MVTFLYRTRTGHLLLRLMRFLRADKLTVLFLRSGISRLMIPSMIRRRRMDRSLFAEETFKSWRDFFLRHKKELVFDAEETHLVSPCDGLLSAYRIRKDGTLRIKGRRYTLEELLTHHTDFAKGSRVPRVRRDADRTASAVASFEGGCALVLRLTTADYHHYHYFDDCVQHAHSYIEGELYSVQPEALRAYPVFAVNRRSVSLLETEHFGRVIQMEVGAFAVGGIVNHFDEGRHARGEEKGHFDLCGSTIVLLFEKDVLRLNADFREAVSRGQEIRVRTGEKIGVARQG